MNLLKEALEDSREILRLRGDCKDHCRLVKDLLVLKELDAAKEALSKAQAIYTESSALKDLAGELTVAEEVHKRSRKSLEDYESRELATKEKELLSQLDQSWVKVRRQWAQRSDPCTHMHMENYGAESEGLQGVKFHCSRCNKEIKEPAKKIEGYRRYGGGVDGLNKKVKDVILSAYDTVRYPVLHSAACGDTASMAVLRESPEMYLENVIRGGYISLLKDIIANNRELLEWREPAGGLTPLMIAARAGNLPCVDYLKSLGANIYAKDSVGFTALKHAHDFGYVDVEECLTNAATIIDTTHTVSRDTTRTVSTHTVSRDTTHTVSRNNGHKFSFYLPFFKKKGNK
eukprot:gene22159-28691_t